ncbi:Maf family protein [Aliidiomarina quisquiliarum]|uniref:Maf family protein n=1 Tax=Aliidiomarina quisquiliarum TaxID=2938947 RepID=UPI00208E18D3|nr:Maf family protein [Aliidiomarina quisquiliarum]MCO4320848.1 Maf family nucleotide pyrophosphatase [Aliidiomarina quisquiliarum]
MSKPLILASSSPFRKELLQRLKLPFDTASPNIDETAFVHESPIDLVQRLAETKAAALAQQFPEHYIIGSDQVAVFNEQILGKPYTEEKAFAQLQQFSGSKVMFYTGLSVYDSKANKHITTVAQYAVYFRTLTDTEIRAYIKEEQPLQCAGSFKSEGLGVCLFERMAGDDPTSLIGLPLIQLSQILRQLGISPLSAN